MAHYGLKCCFFPLHGSMHVWTTQGGVRASRRTDRGPSGPDVPHGAQTVLREHLQLEGPEPSSARPRPGAAGSRGHRGASAAGTQTAAGAGRGAQGGGHGGRGWRRRQRQTARAHAPETSQPGDRVPRASASSPARAGNMTEVTGLV